jgi:hypothetical protein
MSDNPEAIFFPDSSGEQPPAGVHRNVLIKSVKYLGIVTSGTFKDKNGNPVSKPMLEVSLEFKVADKLLVWKRQFTLTASPKGALFPLFLAAVGQTPAVGGPGAQAMQDRRVDLSIKYEPAQNGGGSWPKIEWVTAPTRN